MRVNVGPVSALVEVLRPRNGGLQKVHRYNSIFTAAKFSFDSQLLCQCHNMECDSIVMAVEFSSDSQLLVSVSYNRTQQYEFSSNTIFFVLVSHDRYLILSDTLIAIRCTCYLRPILVIS